MSVFDLFSMAFLNLWRRKLRAILTALGMAIGTTSIVVMVSIGIGLNESITEMFADMGSLTKIEVWQGGGYVMDASGNMRQQDTVYLDDKAIESFKQLEHVVTATPIVQTSASIKKGKYVCQWLQLYGIDMEVAELFDVRPTEGELPGRGTKTKPVVMMTSDVVQNFYDSRWNMAMDAEGNPLIDLMNDRFKMTFDMSNFQQGGGGVMVYGGAAGTYMDTASMYGSEQGATAKGRIYDLQVSGVMNTEGSWEYYSTAFIDNATLEELMKDNKDFTGYDPKKKNYDSVWVKVDDMENVMEVSTYLRDVMGFQTYSPSEYIGTFQDQMGVVQAVLLAIGAVSMIVAAIGIMNTMMMSIYERTREIGVIKVLGCKMSNILKMFLVESSYIGLLGGLAGLVVSYALSFAINSVLSGTEVGTQLRSVIPAWLALLGVLFSGGVAMLSGLYPSIRAMRLSALAAIRNQ